MWTRHDPVVRRADKNELKRVFLTVSKKNKLCILDYYYYLYDIDIFSLNLYVYDSRRVRIIDLISFRDFGMTYIGDGTRGHAQPSPPPPTPTHFFHKLKFFQMQSLQRSLF